MKNIIFNSESGELKVTEVKSKKLTAIKKAIELNLAQSVIDGFISSYLPATDPAQLIVEQWYEQHLLVESSDSTEVVKKTTTDDNGNEQTETLLNDYEIALAARTALETENDWLRGLLGEDAPERPVFNMTVEQFKLDNASLFDSFKKAQGAEISGHRISLNESNQNGISAVLTGVNLAVELGQDPFPINFKAESIGGFEVVELNNIDEFKSFAIQFMLARKQFF